MYKIEIMSKTKYIFYDKSQKQGFLYYKNKKDNLMVTFSKNN